MWTIDPAATGLLQKEAMAKPEYPYQSGNDGDVRRFEIHVTGHRILTMPVLFGVPKPSTHTIQPGLAESDLKSGRRP